MGSIHALHHATQARDSDASRHAIGLLSGLSAETRKRLEQLIGRPRILHRGERLFSAGSEGDSLYLINSGSFKAHVDSDAGEEQITGFHFTSDLIGFDALETGRHTHTLEALETAGVYRIPFETLQQIARGDSDLQRLLMKKISRQLGDEHRTIFMLGRMNAEQRLAQFFIRLSQVMQESGRMADELNLSMPRHDIANYLGLALETVSRLLHRFQSSGLLKVAHRNVQLLNLDGLQHIVRKGDARLAQAH
ncbi:MAG TPA: helix-turn-helix domain-containing protein [Gammaproteobacteria bacterium]|nr:helix-turn-helix domain-containing protein [Gammaproteobacteria bacterium]